MTDSTAPIAAVSAPAVLDPLLAPRRTGSTPSLNRDTASPPTPRVAHRLRNWGYDTFFQTVHGNRLIYNACWEDPRLDRELLQINPQSRVVTITSAGCNALDYLLDDPAEIHAIDVNPRQNALLELKLRLLQRGDFTDLFWLFGRGSHPDFPSLLQALRPTLSDSAASFWEAKARYFDGRLLRRSFYYHGSSGEIAWTMRTFVLQRRPDLWRRIEALLDATSLEEQERIYHGVEPLLWNRFSRWLVRQPMTLSLLGVPRPQVRLIADEHPGGIEQFVRQRLRHVTTRVPIHDNYFWRVYITGSYRPDCCPNYLKRSHFRTLQRRADRVRPYTGYLASFLESHPAPYSHYILLDHQDWLAKNNPAELAREWRLILANSRPGTRILFRSAAMTVDFLPDFVEAQVRFQPELTNAAHPRDRVGTYGSLHLGIVQ